MSVALAGRTPATFEIKSATLPLVALLLKTADLTTLAGELQARFGDIPDFFDHDPLVLDLSPLAAETALPDFEALITMLRAYRMQPIAVRGGNDEQTAAARAAGLVQTEDVVPSRPAPLAVAAPQPAAQAQPGNVGEGSLLGAVVIDKPLRSGQQVYARGRDLVVMCMVNPGAEVIADGSIHVYAPLRGKAIAGARGNTEARIVSLCLEPELLSIAGVYRTSDVPLPAEVVGKPTQVRLVGGADGKLVLDSIDFSPSPAAGGLARGLFRKAAGSRLPLLKRGRN